ncbi:MAG: histidinol-phosphate transaminase [Clostridia bacterium]|nr:histidinol-phosphate transaminase [Clostridia bacterium]
MYKEPKCRKEILDIKPYVPGKPIEEVQREFGITQVIKLASNENPLGPSPKAVEALQSKIGDIFMYPDGSCYHLKGAIAEKLGVAAENILVGNGSDEIIKLLSEAYLYPGDEVIIPNPSFAEYEFGAKVMGAKCVYSPLKDFRIDLSNMLNRITAKTKMIFVCNPNTPTGSIVYREEVERFLNEVPTHVLVVFDEAYYEYVGDSRYPETVDYVLDGRPNLVALRTFSKIYGLAGLRVGYAVGPSSVIAHVNRVREPFNVNMLAQAAAVAALEDEDHLERSREVNNEGKDYLYKEFERMGLKYWPTETNFIWVDLGKNIKEVFHEMLKKGVIIRTGDVFGYDTFARITIGTPEQNQRLIKVLEEVLSTLN